MKNQTILLSTVLCLLLGHSVSAQHPVIAVQNNSYPLLFINLDEAIDEANDGDTIYLPGGTFNFTGDIIEKGLHFRGAGHYPVSDEISSQTVINNDIILGEGSDTSSFEGIYFGGSLYVYKESNRKLPFDNLTVKRCNLNNLTLGGFYNGVYTENDVNDILISECILRGSITSYKAEQVIIEKCILEGAIHSFNGSEFLNNIFLPNASFSNGNENILFRNNIILKDNNVLFYVKKSNFYNNLFTDNLEGSTGSENEIDDSNITNVDLDDIFKSFTGNTFEYNHDYQLIDESAGKNAGSDGTDLGIYGTNQPYTNGITSYPFVHQIDIPNKTDENGILHIQVKVSAQDY